MGKGWKHLSKVTGSARAKRIFPKIKFQKKVISYGMLIAMTFQHICSRLSDLHNLFVFLKRNKKNILNLQKNILIHPAFIAFF